MAINGDYAAPITVNGFTCRNCTDVDRAKRNIDPADPTGAKARAKEALGIEDKTKHKVFDAKKIEEAIAAHQAQQDRIQERVNAAKEASGYGADSYRPPQPGSLVNLSA